MHLLCLMVAIIGSLCKQIEYSKQKWCLPCVGEAISILTPIGRDTLVRQTRVICVPKARARAEKIIVISLSFRRFSFRTALVSPLVKIHISVQIKYVGVQRWTDMFYFKHKPWMFSELWTGQAFAIMTKLITTPCRAAILLHLLLLASVSSAAITVYYQQPFPSPTSTASGSKYTGPAAYDPTVLNPPPIPNPPPANQFSLQLWSSASNVPGLSIPQSGAFFGFSIEMSVVDQVCEYLCLFLRTYSFLTYHILSSVGING